MDDLIKYVRTYRLSTGLVERQRLANEICISTSQELRFFVFASVAPADAEDVMQEILIAVFTELDKFNGGSHGEFMGWCHGIARHKIIDYIRKKGRDRSQPTADDELNILAELEDLVGLSMRAAPISAADKMDLDAALEALKKSKPECLDYLLKNIVLGFNFTEIAEQHNLNYDGARMKFNRCLETAQSLVA